MCSGGIRPVGFRGGLLPGIPVRRRCSGTAGQAHRLTERGAEPPSGFGCTRLQRRALRLQRQQVCAADDTEAVSGFNRFSAVRTSHPLTPRFPQIPARSVSAERQVQHSTNMVKCQSSRAIFVKYSNLSYEFLCNVNEVCENHFKKRKYLCYNGNTGYRDSARRAAGIAGQTQSERSLQTDRLHQIKVWQITVRPERSFGSPPRD